MSALYSMFRGILLKKVSLFNYDQYQHCQQDAVFKKSINGSAKEKNNHLTILLNEGTDVLKKSVGSSVESHVSVEYLEAIAKIRYVCFSVSEILYGQSLLKVDSSSTEQALLTALQKCCEDTSLNTEISGPGIFFLKQIARRYGMSFLAKICVRDEVQWIIPPHLRKLDKVTSL